MQADLQEVRSEFGEIPGSVARAGELRTHSRWFVDLLCWRRGSRPGAEVIFSSHTMVATASAIHFAGRDSGGCRMWCGCLMDSGGGRAAITPRHIRRSCRRSLNGRTADMEALETFDVAKHGLLPGGRRGAGAGFSRFREQCAGTFGAAAAVRLLPGEDIGLSGRWRCCDCERSARGRARGGAPRSRPGCAGKRGGVGI